MTEKQVLEYVNLKVGCQFGRWPGGGRFTYQPFGDGLIIRGLRDPGFYQMIDRSLWMRVLQWWLKMQWQLQTGKRWWEE